MKKNQFILFILLLCSCEKNYDKVIDIDFPYSTNVICLMADDATATEVRLNQIKKLGEPVPTNPDYYAEAKVQISDGVNNITLNYDSSLHVFNIDSVNFKVAKGNSYSLKVVLKDGSEISSSCDVPIENIPIYSHEFKDINDFTYSYSINWQNDDTNLKFYIFQFFIKYQFPTNGYYTHVLSSIVYEKPSNVTDATLTGIKNIQSGTFGGSASDINLAFYYTNEETFRYYDSALKNVSGDLYGQPSIVSTNIVGGTGIFGPLISK